jgi:hypothetical protein
MSEQQMVEWDRPKRERLRKAYNEAVTEKRSQFTFEGNEYVTGYAKYLLEYLDTRLGA